MSKYKAGQNVKVRSDLVAGRIYGYYFNEMMSKYVGKEVTISGVYGDVLGSDVYSIVEDGNFFAWHEDMFEQAEKPMERKTLIIEHIEQPAKMEIYIDRVIVNDPATIMFYRVGKYDENSGQFIQWGEQQKIVAKCNKEAGDKFDVQKGVEVAVLKAYRKEIDKLLRKM